MERPREAAYTSTGVRPPWVTAQQTAPAKACDLSARRFSRRDSALTNLLYSATPESFCGSLAAAFWITASSLVEPVDLGGSVAAMATEWRCTRRKRTLEGRERSKDDADSERQSRR